jgi:diguanylate cyclase (GGDEF)-like protein/PAS domain S-box-containing protein
MSAPARPPFLSKTPLLADAGLRELQVVMAHAGVGIVFIRRRTVVRCNQRFAEIFGFLDPAKVVGLSSASLYPDDAAFHALGAAAYPVMASGVPYKAEIPMRRQNGEIFWTHLTGTLVDPADTEQGSIWIVDDIEAQKLAQAQLQSLLSQQQLILSNAMVGIVFLRDRRVTQCNESFERLFGYEPGELEGSSSRQWYLTEEDWRAAGERCYAPLQQGLSFEGEMTLATKQGTPICCEVRAKAIDSSRLELGSIWITMDITARKEAESELQLARAELEQLVQARTAELRHTVLALENKIVEQAAAEARIQQLAHYDALTGLPNRTLLAALCQQVISQAQRARQPAALMFLDLDNFKAVNDSLGHRVGDAVLVVLANRLKTVLREQDTIARLGGDEFILLLPDTDAAGATQLALKLLDATLAPIQRDGHELVVTPSIGIALYPQDGSDLDALSRCADSAMYRAKADGRNGYSFYTADIQAHSDAVLRVSNALRRAQERDQFTLHYQPQVELASGRITGVEALLRWNHPELGAIPPHEFIPIAESTGLILPIGEWVLRTALQQLADWIRDGLAPVRMAVNLSSVQFRHTEFPQLVDTVLHQTGVSAQWLELELTEGVAMTDPASAIAIMAALHRRGVGMAIDDFGTGYSSLAYLKRFQVRKLKIDRTFVRDITDDVDDKAIVGAIISMARSLGLQTLAEGVETPGQLAFLREQGCDEVQGYYFSRPVPADAMAALLRKGAISQ